MLVFILRILWFVLAGWWLAIMHISAALALAITIDELEPEWAVTYC